MAANNTTKQRIFDLAIDLFSEKGYANVSVRDIASQAGIKVSSLYNHFPSKADLLKALYDYYATELSKILPSEEALLKEAEILPPHEVLRKLDVHFEPEIEEKMNRIAAIAIMEYRAGLSGTEFVRKNILSLSDDLLLKVIHKMIEVKKIEPIDAESFITIVSCFSLGAVVVNLSGHQVGLEKWQDALRLLFSIIKPITS